MNLREKLLLQLAKDPNYQGKDDTEKALVAELKAEISKEENSNSNVDAEVKQAAKEMASELVTLVKELTAAQTANQAPTRNGVQTDPNAGQELDFDAEFASYKESLNRTLTKKQEKDLKKAYKFAEFVKGLIRKDDTRIRALSEGTDADGGYLVPDEFRAELIQHLLTTDAIRNYATVIPMDGKLLSIPKLTSDVRVFWGTENQSISTTTVDFGEVQLTPFRLNAIIYTSRELYDDSAISILEILRRRFVDRVRDEENKMFITGTGTAQPKGIDSETLRSVSAGNSLSPDHVTNAYWKLDTIFRRSAKWLLNSRTIAWLENKKDSNGQYLYPSLQGEVPTLKGKSLIVDDYCPSSKMFFGDWSYYLVGDRQQVTMEVTTEGANTWEKHQLGLKLIERVDGECGLTDAFVEITNTGVS